MQHPAEEQYTSYRRGEASGNKVAAGVCAILLGCLGIHKFILGYPGAGICMLLVSIFGALLFFIGPIIMSIIALVEGIIYLTMNDQEFDRVHGRHLRPWF
jgi:TM2 domain-containing membrane protein YozV